MKTVVYELCLKFDSLFPDFKVVDAKVKEIVDYFGKPGKDYNISSDSNGIIIWFKHRKDFLEAAIKWEDLRNMK
jgi:hypothetical protein